jgi:hypothetical protein
VFTLSFVIAEREDFCDQAIKIAGAVHEALGIEDSRRQRLADFSLKRESFLWLDLGWVTEERMLRIDNQLPHNTTREMLGHTQ